MKVYPMCVEALPAFVPRLLISEYLQEPTLPAALKRQGYRNLGRYCSRDATMWLRSGWYWYAKVELYLLGVYHALIDELCRQRILVGPEGCFIWELRLNDPALWRWK